MEQNAMEVVNDNTSDEQADVEMKHQYEKDNECKEEKQGSFVSLNELAEKCCDTKDELREINGHNSNENNEYLSSAEVMQSQQLKSDPSCENSSEIEIIPQLNDVFGHKLEAEHDFDFFVEQTENFDLSCDETNIISPGFSDSLYTESFYCSLYSTSLSSPSSISPFSCLPGTSNEHSDYSLTNEEDFLFNYLEPISETNEIIETKKDADNFETLPLVKTNHINDTFEKKKLIECDLLQYVLENVKFEDNNEVQNNSECFVGDKIIINPDIMYNIELKLHLKKIQLLAEQVFKTPDDLTVLNKCMELMSIPEMKKGRQIITEECSRPFSEDISESNYYNIQHKDWNKIIVNQAAVLSHVGFDFASKDTLFLIRDEAINYIKRLAGIMKKNFDIQSKSSSPSNIDPIQNSLQEMGMKDGVAELVKYYENDVFGRRKKLLKECEHFQSTINQFVKRSLLTPMVKNKYDTQELFVEEQSTSKINATEENVFTEEKASTSTESRHIDNIDAVPVKSEYIKTNTVDVDNRKMYYTTFSNTDIQFNDLLKCSHMISVPSNSSNSKLDSFTNKKSFLSTDNSSKKQTKKSNNLLRNEKLSDILKSGNIFSATENNINIDMSKIQSTSSFNKTTPNFVKSIGLDQAAFQKIIDEFKGNFKHESVYDNGSKNIRFKNNPDIDDEMNGDYSDDPRCEPE